jgi:hypothetical protein
VGYNVRKRALWVAGLTLAAAGLLLTPVVRIDEETAHRIRPGLTMSEVEAIIGASPGWHDGFVGIRASLPGYKSEWLPDVRHNNPEEWFGRNGAILVWFDKQGRVLTATYYYGEPVSFHPMAFLRERAITRFFEPGCDWCRYLRQ